MTDTISMPVYKTLIDIKIMKKSRFSLVFNLKFYGSKRNFLKFLI